MTTTVRPEPARDQWGRYLLPDPATGQVRAYTRTTTHAHALSDQTALGKWQRRKVAEGLALDDRLRSGLLALDPTDRDAVDAYCEEAMAAAGAGVAAQTGTDLHTYTELVDTHGLTGVDVPEEFANDVAAYWSCMETSGILRPVEWIERIVVNSTVGVAGTFDRIVILPDGRVMIADLKTGRDLRYGWGDIAIQLAVYANADGMYDPATDSYEPMPTGLDRFTALVMHLPVGQARCSLWQVDIASGWDAAKLAAKVRTWRTRKDLAMPVAPESVALGGELLEQISAAGSALDLSALWSQHVSTGAWSEIHTEAARLRKLELTG